MNNVISVGISGLVNEAIFSVQGASLSFPGCSEIESLKIKRLKMTRTATKENVGCIFELVELPVQHHLLDIPSANRHSRIVRQILVNPGVTEVEINGYSKINVGQTHVLRPLNGWELIRSVRDFRNGYAPVSQSDYVGISDVVLEIEHPVYVPQESVSKRVSLGKEKLFTLDQVLDMVGASSLPDEEFQKLKISAKSLPPQVSVSGVRLYSAKSIEIWLNMIKPLD